jgi:U6 snRNA-associated Sm-like protein LSm2
VKASAHTPTARAPRIAAAHKVDFGFVENLLRRRACSLPSAEVSPAVDRDAIGGTLVSVDQYLNIKLENTQVVDENRYPHMKSVRNCFIRGSVVRYVQLPADAVDVDILHDATRREARGA